MSLSAYDTVDRCQGGTDFGATGFVILHHNGIRIAWRPGHSYWSGIGMPRSYSPAKLYAEAVPTGRGGTTNIEIFEGGRLTDDRWLAVREKVAELLDVSLEKIPEMLPGRTVEIP